MTTQQDIRRWLEEGKRQGATHVIVMCDTFDHEDYPLYVKPGESARQVAARPGSMQKVMECYSLALDIETQLAEHRSNHWE